MTVSGGYAAGAPKRRARLAPGLLVVAAFLGLVDLGTWQLYRLEWKTALIETLEARLNAPPIALAAALEAPERAAYRHVALEGAFLHDRELLLGARPRRGQPGARLFTPLRTVEGPVVLVDRGWLPAGVEELRGRPTGVVRLAGVLRLPQRPTPFTPENRPERGEWYWVDAAAMADAVGLPAFPLYLQAEPDGTSSGLPLADPVRLDIANDHLEYAITWYALAAGLAVVAVLRARPGRGPPA